MNVPDFLHPRKEPGTSLYIGVIMLLIALIAFGLGRLSARSTPKSGLKVLYPEGMTETRMGGGQGASAASYATSEAPLGTASGTTSLQGSGQIVASKSGTKYHFTWCSGAKAIKEENKIYFASTEEARAAGFEPASNCKGLQ